MMKRHLALVCLGLTALVSACSPDLGNYTYTPIPDPVIVGIEDTYSVLAFSQLQIGVSFETSLDQSGFEYEWRALGAASGSELTTIARTKDLDWTVSLPSGSYTIYYKVTDTSSGVFWQKEFTLEIRETTSEGWMVLCRTPEGKVDLQMISAVTSQVYKDILRSSGLAPLSGPKSVMWSEYSDPSSPYYLLTEELTTRLSRYSFSWSDEFVLRYEMGMSGSVPVADFLVDGVAEKLMIAGGKLYKADCLVGIGLFGEIPGGGNFAPYVCTNKCSSSIIVPAYMLYNEGTKELMAYVPNFGMEDLGRNPVLYTMNNLVKFLRNMTGGGEVVGTAYDQFPSGMELVALYSSSYDPDNSNMGVNYAVLRSGDRFEVYGVQLGEMWGAVQIGDCAYAVGRSCYTDVSSCASIAEASNFVFSPLRSAMYYSVGSDVYMVDLSSAAPAAVKQISLAGEEIRCLEFKGYDLAVASVAAGSTGSLRIYEGFESDGDFSSVKPEVYTGLGDIVDIEYKEMLK